MVKFQNELLQRYATTHAHVFTVAQFIFLTPTHVQLGLRHLQNCKLLNINIEPNARTIKFFFRCHLWLTLARLQQDYLDMTVNKKSATLLLGKITIEKHSIAIYNSIVREFG